MFVKYVLSKEVISNFNKKSPCVDDWLQRNLVRLELPLDENVDEATVTKHLLETDFFDKYMTIDCYVLVTSDHPSKGRMAVMESSLKHSGIYISLGKNIDDHLAASNDFGYLPVFTEVFKDYINTERLATIGDLVTLDRVSTSIYDIKYGDDPIERPSMLITLSSTIKYKPKLEARLKPIDVLPPHAQYTLNLVYGNKYVN